MARGSTAASACRSSKQRRSKKHRKQPRTGRRSALVAGARSPPTPRVEGSGRTVLACPTPSRKPHQPTRHLSRPRPAVLIDGRLRWLHRLPLVACRHATVSTVTRFQGQADRPGQATGRARTMTEASVSFAGNRTDDPELRHTEGEIARAMFRVAVSGRREQEASFSPWSCGSTRPSTPASPSRRAADSWSWADSSSGAGPRRTAAPDRWSRVVAEELGPSLRWATATTTRTTRNSSQGLTDG